MRAAATAALAILCLCVTAQSQDKASQPQEEKKGLPAIPFSFDFSYMEKTFSLKTKAFLWEKEKGRITFIWEHEKDLTDAELSELKSLVTSSTTKIRVLLFDPDNVAIALPPGGPANGIQFVVMSGEVTGVKGDAFRLGHGGTTILPETADKTVKLVIRPTVKKEIPKEVTKEVTKETTKEDKK